MKILFLLISLGMSSLLIGQNVDTLYKRYTRDFIYRYGTTIMKGNERLTLKDLSREFSMCDLGLDLYHKSKRCRTTSTILRYASMLSGFIYLGIAANNGKKNTAYLPWKPNGLPFYQQELCYYGQSKPRPGPMAKKQRPPVSGK